jgi:diacylglycerol kinase family enzyme
MADTLLIYNPAAGRVSVRPFISGVIRTLSDYGWRVEVAESLDGRHTTQLAHMAASENFRAVFVIGGDGTVGQAASGLIGSQTALGVLPAGSANVWALELGMKAFIWPRWGLLRENARLRLELEEQSQKGRALEDRLGRLEKERDTVRTRVQRLLEQVDSLTHPRP